MPAADPTTDSTLAPMRDLAAVRRAMRWRVAGILALAVIVLAATAGWLGVRSATTTAAGAGYRATLTYPAVARAGWDVPWHLVVRRPGGFGDGTVTVAVSQTFFDLYETQGFHPSPAAETSDDQYVYLEFAPPPGDTLVIDYDAYIQPTSQLGRRAHLLVLTDGTERVRLDWRTRLLP